MEEEETQQNLSGEQLLALVTQPVGDIHHRTLALEEMGGRKVQQVDIGILMIQPLGDIEALVSPPHVGDIGVLVLQPLDGDIEA